MSETKFHKGLYTENCFVLAEGWYEDRIFHVVAMGHPPIEASEVSCSDFGICSAILLSPKISRLRGFTVCTIFWSLILELQS